MRAALLVARAACTSHDAEVNSFISGEKLAGISWSRTAESHIELAVDTPLRSSSN